MQGGLSTVSLWQVIAGMLTPLEYLLFNTNMIFLVSSYFEYPYIQRAANLLQAPDTIPIINTMNDLQLMILVFFAMKLCLTASQYISLELVCGQ